LLASEVALANNFFTRLKGLLFTKGLPVGRGLFLKPCNQIHMFGMGYSIDAIFVDANNVVVGIVSEIKPGRISRVFWKARGCLELPGGTISSTGTVVGDKLEIV
jgi:uncharacterized membrane protein (UPF0127 family)